MRSLRRAPSHSVAAAFAQERDASYAVRLETAMEGAHGMLIPVEALAAAKAS